jgi:hypothetical protein
MMLALWLAACDAPPTLSGAYQVRVDSVDRLQSPAWNILSADLDVDGDLDVLVHGHRGREGDLIYFREGEKFTRYGPVFSPGQDRHACTAADSNGDRFPELYCTTGAERGKGLNANELWINRDGRNFEAVQQDFGAEDAAGRGRLAAFIRFDDDHLPDLVTTVWGPRDDALPNESRIYRNVGGRFEPIDTGFHGRWGGRCLAVYDLNDDGLDDLFACAEERGARYYLNTGQGDFAPRRGADGFTWWWSAAIERGRLDPHPVLALSGIRFNRSIIVLRGVLEDGDETIRRFTCNFDTVGRERQVFCGAVLLTDISGDGHVDLYLSRREGWMLQPPEGDIEDLIILGPDFATYLPVPIAAQGAGARAAAVEGGVMRLSAGENWPGSLDYIKLEKR